MARCKHPRCKRKILLVVKEMSRCRCGKLYCQEHRLNHNCTFDYKGNHRETLSKELTKVIPKKIFKV